MWKTLVDFIYVYIFGPLVLRPGSELTDHTEYAFAVAFVSVGVVCQRNEQTRFVDITRRLDNSLSLSLPPRERSKLAPTLIALKCGMSICVRAEFIDRYINRPGCLSGRARR